MLVRVNVIFGVRHHAEYISLRVANPCNVLNRAVRVDGIFAIRRSSVRMGVSESNLIIFNERRKRKEFGCLEISFAMGDGTFDQIVQAFCPNAYLRNSLESRPATFEMSLCVE